MLKVPHAYVHTAPFQKLSPRISFRAVLNVGQQIVIPRYINVYSHFSIYHNYSKRDKRTVYIEEHRIE